MVAGTLSSHVTEALCCIALRLSLCLVESFTILCSLDAGLGEEVRQGRGWMFWRLSLSLTAAGEEALEHVVATVFRAIQVLQLHRRCLVAVTRVLVGHHVLAARQSVLPAYAA
jgi:hypothetical protein